MKFLIKIAISDNALPGPKRNLFYEFAKEIELFFESKIYGNDLREVEISFLMVFARIGYEDWYKPRKPKYINFKTKKSNLTGEILTIEKTFFYEIKLSDKQLNSFINDNDELSRKLLSTLILDSLSNLDTLSKKISDFEIEKFKADIRLFFQHQNLA